MGSSPRSVSGRPVAWTTEHLIEAAAKFADRVRGECRRLGSGDEQGTAGINGRRGDGRAAAVPGGRRPGRDRILAGNQVATLPGRRVRKDLGPTNTPVDDGPIAGHGGMPLAIELAAKGAHHVPGSLATGSMTG